MANVRDSDTSLWLHNKLGTSTDSWSSGGGSLCTQLNSEVLRNIEHCFPDLQTQVKLKLLLSFFHIPRRNLEEWKNELEAIVEVASLDSELWVGMLAEVLKTFPSRGALNVEVSELDESRPIFSDMINELKKLLNKHSDLGLLPLECLYLNRTAVNSVVGQQPNPPKHFTLKRKPKSAALRQELLNKAAEVQANVKKAAAPTVPVRSRGMPRKMTDTTPLKGLPSRARAASIRPAMVAPPARPPPRAGIKLLDIADQPATLQQIKKRRKLEMEETSKKPPAAPASPPPPDYAKGLNTYTLPKAEAADPGAAPGTERQVAVVQPQRRGENAVEPSETPAAPPSPPPLVPAAPEPPAPAASAPAAPTPAVPASAPPPLARLEPAQTPLTVRPILLQQTTGAKPIILGQQQKLLITGQPGQKHLLVAAGAHGTLLSPQAVLKGPAGVPLLLQGGKTVLLTDVDQMAPRVVQQPARASLPAAPLHAAVLQQGAQSGPAAPAQPVAAPPAQPRRGLSLTREQMMEAQDMFRNANRVTRPEKALILGFMAGSRDNPCPNLGNIVTIKLSENIENVLQSDDTYLTMLSEMHFQMNYNNGQWTRLKKYRPIDGVTPQKIPPGSTVISSSGVAAQGLSVANQNVS